MENASSIGYPPLGQNEQRVEEEVVAAKPLSHTRVTRGIDRVTGRSRA